MPKIALALLIHTFFFFFFLKKKKIAALLQNESTNNSNRSVSFWTLETVVFYQH